MKMFAIMNENPKLKNLKSIHKQIMSDELISAIEVKIANIILYEDNLKKLIQTVENIPNHDDAFVELNKKIDDKPSVSDMNNSIVKQVDAIPDAQPGKDAHINNGHLIKVKEIILNDPSFYGKVTNAIKKELQDPKFKGENLVYKNLSRMEKESIHSSIVKLLDEKAKDKKQEIEFKVEPQELELLVDGKVVSKAVIPYVDFDFDVANNIITLKKPGEEEIKIKIPTSLSIRPIQPVRKTGGGGSSSSTSETAEDGLPNYKVPAGETLTVPVNKQHFINGELIIEGEVIIEGELVFNTAKQFQPYTTLERDALEFPPTGLFIYNTDTKELNWYDGSWQVPATGGGADLLEIKYFGDL